MKQEKIVTHYTKHPHNMAWGDDDGKSLYLCAQSGLYKMRLNIPGIRPGGRTGATPTPFRITCIRRDAERGGAV